MDAMQQQQMALAEQRRRQQTLKRIEAALRRVEDGSYGECAACGEPIAEARLRMDPVIALCLDCARPAKPRGRVAPDASSPGASIRSLKPSGMPWRTAPRLCAVDEARPQSG